MRARRPVPTELPRAAVDLRHLPDDRAQMAGLLGRVAGRHGAEGPEAEPLDLPHRGDGRAEYASCTQPFTKRARQVWQCMVSAGLTSNLLGPL